MSLRRYGVDVRPTGEGVGRGGSVLVAEGGEEIFVDRGELAVGFGDNERQMGDGEEEADEWEDGTLPTTDFSINGGGVHAAIG